MPAKKPAKPAKSAPTAKSTLPLAQLDELAAWLQSAPVNEVEVEQKGIRLRLSKAGTAAAPAAIMAAPAAVGSAPQPVESAKNTFKSPMVGTFYRAPGPESKSFVEEGSRVQSGQTLCIIEAMKTMNQIAADRAGIVKKILVENAMPVEFGQPLFVIE
ncbi:MAG: acetyl-CoA carboxylase biotin carboxyl carrier protein [Proteobacteria bacterium]|nr:acetyl-CoA carboxylase biotin carboxyl carrier protein [Pseudomonadota bacterium]